MKGKELKEIRNYYKMGQREFAEEICLKKNTLAVYESSDRNIPLSVCEVIRLKADSWKQRLIAKLAKDIENINMSIEEIKRHDV